MEKKLSLHTKLGFTGNDFTIGTYTSEKPVNNSRIDNIQSKLVYIEGNIVN